MTDLVLMEPVLRRLLFPIFGKLCSLGERRGEKGSGRCDGDRETGESQVGERQLWNYQGECCHLVAYLCQDSLWQSLAGVLNLSVKTLLCLKNY